MARIMTDENQLKAFSEAPSGNNRYPWDEWVASRDVCTVSRDTDFKGKTENFRYRIKQEGAKRGATVDFKKSPGKDVIVFQFMPKAETGQAAKSKLIGFYPVFAEYDDDGQLAAMRMDFTSRAR